MKKILPVLMLLLAGAGLIGWQSTSGSATETTPSETPLPAEIPVPGMVTMVDLGAKSCVPCKMMAPILAELETEYRGTAAVIFIDVWKNPDMAPKFGIKSIPTQIFYDENGKEVFRHAGFLDKQYITAQFDKMGVTPGGN